MRPHRPARADLEWAFRPGRDLFQLNERGSAVEDASMERRPLPRHTVADVVGGLLLLTVAALLVGVALLVAAS
jgi:hypothetical protein